MHKVPYGDTHFGRPDTINLRKMSHAGPGIARKLQVANMCYLRVAGFAFCFLLLLQSGMQLFSH